MIRCLDRRSSYDSCATRRPAAFRTVNERPHRDPKVAETGASAVVAGDRCNGNAPGIIADPSVRSIRMSGGGPGAPEPPPDSSGSLTSLARCGCPTGNPSAAVRRAASGSRFYTQDHLLCETDPSSPARVQPRTGSELQSRRATFTRHEERPTLRVYPRAATSTIAPRSRRINRPRPAHRPDSRPGPRGGRRSPGTARRACPIGGRPRLGPRRSRRRSTRAPGLGGR